MSAVSVKLATTNFFMMMPPYSRSKTYHSPSSLTVSFGSQLMEIQPRCRPYSQKAKLTSRHRVTLIVTVRHAWKRQRRTGDALPRQAQRVVEEGQALIKEAKGYRSHRKEK